MSKPKFPKPKMATIREIYDRVLWDSRLNHRAFSLGFSDRISGNMREKRLSEWAVDGDIPWHRIRYVKCGETIVWDRDRLIDLFITGELPVAAWVVATENAESANQQQQIYPDLSPPTLVKDFPLSIGATRFGKNQVAPIGGRQIKASTPTNLHQSFRIAIYMVKWLN